MNVIVDRLLTNYRLTGKGKLVLLLHGWGDSAKGLADLQDRLAKKYQVLAPDLPGFGGTQAPDRAWDLDNYAQFVADLLRKLELRQPYALIGHSNGAALAIRAASSGALKPEKLVLMAASGVRTNNATRRSLFKAAAKTGKVATLWLPPARRRALRKKLYVAAGSDMLVAPHLQDTFKKTVRQDVQADAAALELPALLVYGTEDKATPSADGRQYTNLIKNSRLEIIEGAGHFVYQEKPEKVFKLVEDFLA